MSRFSLPGLALILVHPAFGAFALVNPSSVQSLSGLPESGLRDAAIRAADKQLNRVARPLRRVHTEGTLPHQGIRDESIESERDWGAARDLALAAALTRDQRYSSAASRIIAAWLDVYHPGFNPIDETNLEALFLAYDLLPQQAKNQIAPSFENFANEIAKGYLDSMRSLHGGTATNNWQSHRIKLAALGAYESGDDGLINRARQAFIKQLSQNIQQDGETVDFRQRDAIHYVVYDLQPLVTAALAAKVHSEDWYSLSGPSGATLREALDWLVPYAEGTKIHREFAHSTVRFDYERRDAGVAGFSGDFDPKNARILFALAARLDARYVPVATRLDADELWLDFVMPLGAASE